MDKITTLKDPWPIFIAWGDCPHRNHPIYWMKCDKRGCKLQVDNGECREDLCPLTRQSDPLMQEVRDGLEEIANMQNPYVSAVELHLACVKKARALLSKLTEAHDEEA